MIFVWKLEYKRLNLDNLDLDNILTPGLLHHTFRLIHLDTGYYKQQHLV